jgi:EAL domain-containing protein (putative c-di-GMP-specific phosphodiesterase class I)
MAREVGPKHFHIYDPDTDQGWEMAYQRRILEQIAEAIDEQRMSLVFQPIVSLRGAQSERYEVFLRMCNAQGEELLPEAVFNVAHTHRLGMILDRWVIAKALNLLRDRQTGGRSTTLFVNVSPAILRDEKVVAWIEEGLNKTGVYSKDLVFEVAETTIALQPERWRKFAKDVRGMGCGFALDRFGNQEQSRDLFRQLPTDYVKLNGRFLDDLPGNSDKQQALKNIINDLTMLKIDTIVSGIEDLPTLQAIWSCGVEHVQGFFLQRPHDKMDYAFNKNVL